MNSDVKEWIKSCEKCQRVKTPNQIKAPLNPIRPKRPLEIITVDITGPLPKTLAGFLYILVLIDHFTKWVKLYALKSQTAIECARKLFNYICLMGIPNAILSDQGPNFQSELLAELWDLLDVHKMRTTPYHPECNGLTERFNRTLKTMLSCFVNEHQNNWDEYLDQLAFAYNTSVQSTTQFTPYELMFGRKAKLPIDLFYKALDQSDIEHSDNCPAYLNLNKDGYANRISENFNSIYKLVGENRDIKMLKTKLRYDRVNRAANFNINDKVLLLNTAVKMGLTKKLSEKWRGPLIVIENVNNVNYRIQGYSKSGKSKVLFVHRNRLKKYHGNLNNFLDDDEIFLNESAPNKNKRALNISLKSHKHRVIVKRKRGRPPKLRKEQKTAQPIYSSSNNQNVDCTTNLVPEIQVQLSNVQPFSPTSNNQNVECTTDEVPQIQVDSQVLNNGCTQKSVTNVVLRRSSRIRKPVNRLCYK